MQSQLKVEAEDLYMDRTQGHQISKNMLSKIPNLNWEMIAYKFKNRLEEHKLSDLELYQEKRALKSKSGGKKK